MKIYGFYGKDNPLSNLFTFKNEEGKIWSVEHEFQHIKAESFGDKVVAAKIYATTDPKEAKRLGKTVANFDKEYWDTHRDDIMRKILQYKWKACREFRNHLLDVYAHYDEIAEAAPRDTYWGTGYGKERTEAGESRGKNKMGKLLTELVAWNIVNL